MIYNNLPLSNLQQMRAPHWWHAFIVSHYISTSYSPQHSCLADGQNRPKAHQRRDRAGYLRQQIRKGEKGARTERSGGRHAPTGLAAKPTGGGTLFIRKDPDVD